MKRLLTIIAISMLILDGCTSVSVKISNSNSQKNDYLDLVGLSIPKESKILESSDTHRGFHGDGDYYEVIQLDEKIVKSFEKEALKTGKWNKLPMGKEINLFIFGYEKKDSNSSYKYVGHGKQIPDNIKNGIYYFRDKYVEQYPDEKNINILIRPAYNFVFSILDLDTGKLYILESDS